VLFQIDPVTLKNALAAAEQQEAVAQAALEVARIAEEKATRDYTRFKRLHDEMRVTDNEFELYQMKSQQAVAQLALAHAQVGQAKASVAIAKKNYSDSTGLAPLTGVITARAHEPGEHVTSGTRMVTIEDPHTIEAIAYLPAQYYADVVEGKTHARAFLAGRDAGLFTITRRNPSINALLRTFEIRGILQSEHAVSGAMVDITVVFSTQKNIGVPTAAIVLRNNTPCVFTIAGKQAHLRKVKTGLENAGWTEIVEGLQDHEAIVVEGQSQLEEGMHVSVR
jgi:RND family efflux transporter MFP subunit